MVVVTASSPVVGGIALQLTVNVVEAVPPAVTETVRGLAPLTVQFDATAERVTEWPPAVSPVMVALLLIPIPWPPASTVSV